jgi:1-acyl-sn-glycerol-3-phosphate acyltransferase
MSRNDREIDMAPPSLLGSARFAPFFWTQLLGALNDNVFKNALVILFAFGAAQATIDPGTLVNLAGGVFILPFFLFSATAGDLATKYEKSRLVRAVKLFEIAIMLVGAAGFAIRSVEVLLVALFLMGLHSTIFGPVKYSILPQLLPEERLMAGNALVESATFVAILVGTIAGGVLVAVPGWGPALAALAVVVIAVAGWAVSRGVPAVPPEDPTLRIRWNPVRETIRIMGYARENRTVFLSILGISWFWFFGALALAQFPALGREVLGGDEHVVTLLLTVFSVGVGVGCFLCERLSGDKIEIGLVPFGSIGLTVFALDLWLAAGAVAAPAGSLDVARFLASVPHWRLAADLVLLGVFGGFFIVPLLALVQHRSAPSHRSRIIAANNVVNALFMVGAALLGVALHAAGLSVPQLFLFAAIVNAAVALYIYTLVPEFLMRFLVYLLVHVMYRVRRSGTERLPDDGAAVLVCNHVSFVDALVITSVCRRPIRFVMDHHIFKIPVLSFIFRTARAIPIAPAKEDAALKERAFDDVAAALAAGDLVCIFPEGRLTSDGDLSPFRPGIERIVARTPVPVFPLALRGLWGSFFSRDGGPAMRRWPRRFRARIELACGAPLAPDDATVERLEAQVLALRGEAR